MLPRYRQKVISESYNLKNVKQTVPCKTDNCKLFGLNAWTRISIANSSINYVNYNRKSKDLFGYWFNLAKIMLCLSNINGLIVTSDLNSRIIISNPLLELGIRNMRKNKRYISAYWLWKQVPVQWNISSTWTTWS